MPNNFANTQNSDPNAAEIKINRDIANFIASRKSLTKAQKRQAAIKHYWAKILETQKEIRMRVKSAKSNSCESVARAKLQVESWKKFWRRPVQNIMTPPKEQEEPTSDNPDQTDKIYARKPPEL